MPEGDEVAGRADLHFHLLPGVDDGPATMSESLALARAAVEDGTATIACTPHVNQVVVDELPARVRHLRDELRRERLPLEVLCGGELAWDDVAKLSQRELEAITLGPPVGRWLLLEAPLFEPRVAELEAAADDLRERGFGVLMAHPERCPWLFDDHSGTLERELGRGTPLQLNATSLTGDHGADARRRALELAGRAAVISSDAHSLERGPALGRALRAAVEAGVNEFQARRLVDAGPLELLRRGISSSPRPTR